MGLKQSKITYIRRDDERHTVVRPLDVGIFRKLFEYAKHYRGKVNLLVFLVCLRAVQLPLVTWALGEVINGPITSKDCSGIAWGILVFFLLTLFTQITFHFRQRTASEFGESVIHDIRRDLFSKLLGMQMGFFSATRLGRIISRFTSDAESVRMGIQNVVFVSVVQAGSMLVASVMMIYYDWTMFLIMLAMAPVIWGINRYFRLRLIHAYREVQESFSRVTATVAESIKGIKVIQGFARQDVNAQIFKDLVYDHSKYNLRVTETESVFIPLLELNSQIFLSALVLIGGYRVLSPESPMPIGSLIQFLFLSNYFFSPIQVLAGQYNQALTAMTGAERVLNFLEAKPDWEDAPDAEPVKEIRGCVEFRDVGFSYVKGKKILHGISFRADPGKIVALVGPTGGGKSTITNLVAKFYIPDEGQITIDGTDILKIRSAPLREQIGIVIQQNFLFSGTVLENILIGKHGATAADAKEAAAKIDCLDIIEALPDGFDTRVGENGVGLSLGQRQLICFSRAMLADPKILILDEATSSVDAITEAKIQSALAKLLAGRTSFIVAHRLSTIKNADIVLVILNGRIAERGTHRQLLKMGGTYAKLYREFRLSQEI